MANTGIRPSVRTKHQVQHIKSFIVNIITCNILKCRPIYILLSGKKSLLLIILDTHDIDTGLNYILIEGSCITFMGFKLLLSFRRILLLRSTRRLLRHSTRRLLWVSRCINTHWCHYKATYWTVDFRPSPVLSIARVIVDPSYLSTLILWIMWIVQMLHHLIFPNILKDPNPSNTFISIA